MSTWINQICSQENIFTNTRREKSYLLTENWEEYFPELCTQTSNLGKLLGVSDDSGSLAFPTALILEHLEKFVVQLLLHSHSTGFQATDRDMVLNAFLRTGMHHKVLLDTYIGLLNKSKHRTDVTLDDLQLCWSSATLLLQWIDISRSQDNSTDAKLARLNFRSFLQSGLNSLMQENSVFSRILNHETSSTASYAFHTLFQLTKIRVNEFKELVEKLAL